MVLKIRLLNEICHQFQRLETTTEVSKMYKLRHPKIMRDRKVTRVVIGRFCAVSLSPPPWPLPPRLENCERIWWIWGHRANSCSHAVAPR